MKKITVYIENGETTVKLLNPVQRLFFHRREKSQVGRGILDVQRFTKKIRKSWINGRKISRRSHQDRIHDHYTTFSTTHKSDRPVDIHEGLRYVSVGCNLTNRSQNIDFSGCPSNIITSLPIDGTKPLFGTTTKYNDIESEVYTDAGIYNELHFDVKSNVHGIVPGNVLMELYVI
ncbi:Hypothetical predicted protein [Paramuricea clavata]|uniref:Uncharacterized protein n=1 Tax=Paramuricea clavata TaxID=317549 RepID=A0A6S7FN19_PARCT|nr:Hypothetical predicted protein [Paramuricea clavata]